MQVFQSTYWKWTYKFIKKKTDTGQDHDYSTGYLLNYLYFKESFISISIDLSEQQVFDASPKASQLINVTSNLNREENIAFFNYL